MYIAIPYCAALLLLVLIVLNNLLSLGKNVRIARATGISLVVVPEYAYNRVNSIVFARTVSKLCDKLFAVPHTSSWRRLTGSAWPWKLRHAPFADMGTDTFLTVAPGGIIFYTADADVIAQINLRGNDFPKATQLYRHVDIYGKNVVSSGGTTWRRHRSVTAPAFTEKNNQLVWKETLDITQGLLNSWTDSCNREKSIRSLGGDAMKLSLEVIGRAGLGEKMQCSEASEETRHKRNPSSRHNLTFTEALQFLLSHIFYVIAVPKWVLENSPFKTLARCNEAYEEFGRYLQEMIISKKASLKAKEASSDDSRDADLLGQLLKAQTIAGSSGGALTETTTLTDSDVMGNLFMFIIAGHETSANSIHFSIILLALHPEIQRQVQEELTAIFQDRPISAWSYDTDLKQLFNSLLAAVLNEELRLIGPVIAIPKVVDSPSQHISINGRDCSLPAEIMMRLCVSSVHHNPKFWPLETSTFDESNRMEGPRNDLEEFKPQRWTHGSRMAGSSTQPKPQAPLYVPPKGAFIPFSDGQRGCIGKRFAQIEILGALAVIFSEYSVELAVDEWASDEEVARMETSERREVWEKAKDKANLLLREKVTSIITLQLRGAHIPVRFVKRGRERF